MFYGMTRKNYGIDAKTEAEQIKEITGAYKVDYRGCGMFMVYESPEGEAMVERFDSLHGR